MLSVVVDDHDMGITHIIRGDDHLTNAFRQKQLYLACGWNIPEFAHIPLIHGSDGAKLSKRHGALGAEQYREMGFLPETMRNYLLRLGWGHGDEEIISTEQAIEWFDLPAIGRSPARLDLAKLTHLNAHYIRQRPNQELVELIRPWLPEAISVEGLERIEKGMPGLKERAKTLIELAESSLFYLSVLEKDEKALKFCNPEHKALVNNVSNKLNKLQNFTHDPIAETIKATAEENSTKLGDLAQPLRVAITGRTVSPSLFEVMEVLGKEETLKRLGQFIKG